MERACLISAVPQTSPAMLLTADVIISPARPCIFECNPRIGADLAGDVPKLRARAFFDQMAEIAEKRGARNGVLCNKLEWTI